MHLAFLNFGRPLVLFLRQFGSKNKQRVLTSVLTSKARQKKEQSSFELCKKRTRSCQISKCFGSGTKENAKRKKMVLTNHSQSLQGNQ